MDTKATARVEAFSDGVFAVAITLLILAIEVPDIPHGTANRELFQALLATWPSFLAFVISFATILIMWVNHHGLFNLLETVDRRALFATGIAICSSLWLLWARLNYGPTEEVGNIQAHHPTRH